VDNSPTNATDPSGLERLGQTATARKQQAEEKKHLDWLADQPTKKPPPVAKKTKGDGKVIIEYRAALSNFLFWNNSPGLLPHAYVIVQYGDDTFETYGYDGDWHKNLSFDRDNWANRWPWLDSNRVVMPGITGKDVREAYLKRKKIDDGKYNLFNYNCTTQIDALIDSAYSEAGKKRPKRKITVRERCFVVGTPTYTSNGVKSIETVDIGDEILSWNEETNKFEFHPVMGLVSGSSTDLVDMTINDWVLTCTPMHRFLTVGGWKRAFQLEKQSTLLACESQVMELKELRAYKVPSAVKVYNFEVEHTHTYCVGIPGLIAHNFK
jgi:hypothetical protein